MSRQVSDAFKAAAFAQQTDVVFIILCTISSPDLAEDLRVASDGFQLLPDAGVRGVISRGEEYVFLPFTLNLPVQDDTDIARANITIDNVDRRIIAAVRSSTAPLSITIEVVLSSDLDTPEISVEDFQLETVQYDAFTVSGDLSLQYFDQEPFPYGSFSPAGFPGIF